MYFSLFELHDWGKDPLSGRRRLIQRFLRFSE